MEISTIGLDLAKNVFQVHAVDASGNVVIRRAIRRSQVLPADAEREGRVCEFPVEPSLPVECAWDLGIGDSTAIWFFQAVGGEIRVVDFYEASGFGLEHYAKVLANRGYRYGNDHVPHDARVRELGTGRTRVETLFALGRKPVLVPDHKLEDGINAARRCLPRVWFHCDRCAAGLEALRQYRTDFDERTKAFKD